MDKKNSDHLADEQFAAREAAEAQIEYLDALYEGDTPEDAQYLEDLDILAETQEDDLLSTWQSFSNETCNRLFQDRIVAIAEAEAGD